MVLIRKGDTLIIQEAEYIEHGWYIELIQNEITLYEIPYGGGEAIKIGCQYHTIVDALDDANKLT